MMRRKRWCLYTVLACFMVTFVYLRKRIFSQEPDAFISPVDHVLNRNERIFNVTFDAKDFRQNYLLISPRVANVCAGKRVLILVMSGPEEFKARELIRASWANKTNMPDDYLVRFVIGSQKSYGVEVDLQIENQQFDDLIRYDLYDTYENLVLKTHAMFVWQQYFCSDVQYVVKIDDDVAIDLNRLDHFVTSDFDAKIATEREAFFCKAYVHTKPYRFFLSKWYVPRETYQSDYWPDYCHGGIYMTTSPTVKLILENISETNFLRIEDIFFTGFASQKLGIPVYSSDIFCNRQNDKSGGPPCDKENVPYHTSQCEVSRSAIPDAFSHLNQLQCKDLVNKASSYRLCITYLPGLTAFITLMQLLVNFG